MKQQSRDVRDVLHVWRRENIPFGLVSEEMLNRLETDLKDFFDKKIQGTSKRMFPATDMYDRIKTDRINRAQQIRKAHKL